MTEISTIVSTTEFWFSAVLVGLVINVVSSYIPGILGKIFGKAVTSRNKRNECRLANMSGNVLLCHAVLCGRFEIGRFETYGSGE